MSYKSGFAYTNVLAAINAGNGRHVELPTWRYTVDAYGKTIHHEDFILFTVDFDDRAAFDRFFQTLTRNRIGKELQIDARQDDKGVNASFSLPI